MSTLSKEVEGLKLATAGAVDYNGIEITLQKEFSDFVNENKDTMIRDVKSAANRGMLTEDFEGTKITGNSGAPFLAGSFGLVFLSQGLSGLSGISNNLFEMTPDMSMASLGMAATAALAATGLTLLNRDNKKIIDKINTPEGLEEAFKKASKREFKLQKSMDNPPEDPLSFFQKFKLKLDENKEKKALTKEVDQAFKEAHNENVMMEMNKNGVGKEFKDFAQGKMSSLIESANKAVVSAAVLGGIGVSAISTGVSSLSGITSQLMELSTSSANAALIGGVALVAASVVQGVRGFFKGRELEGLNNSNFENEYKTEHLKNDIDSNSKPVALAPLSLSKNEKESQESLFKDACYKKQLEDILAETNKPKTSSEVTPIDQNQSMRTKLSLG